VIVEPTNACNLKCTFCGNRNMSRPWSWLSMELYQRLLDEMVELGVPRITLHTVGEPTLHRELPRMVRLAKAAGLTVTLSTNGTTLDEELTTELVLAGPDILNISVDAVDPERLIRLREGLDPQALFAGIARLRHTRDAIGPICESPWGEVRLPSLVATCVSTREWSRAEEKAYFVRLSPFVDDFYFHWINSHAGYVSDDRHLRPSFLPRRLQDWIHSKVRYSCPYPWDALFLLADGTVSICRWDFDARMGIGRFGPRTLKELWVGQEMMELRKAHMDFDFRRWSMCQSCDGTFYENRHEHYRRTQRIKSRNGFVAARDMWLTPNPMKDRQQRGSGTVRVT